MSSDPPSAGRSPEGSPEPDLASLLRQRGGPLLDGLDRHLPGARAHAEATASYAFSAAVGLGFERSQCEVAREAAALHEIGLIYVPVAIATRTAADRDADEAAVWAEHYEAGYRLARGAGIPEHVCGWLLRARESYDGLGPEGLSAEQIPLESRLIRAACVCHTAIAAAAASGAPPVELAIGALSRRAGGELDPRVVAALGEILERAAG